MSTHTLTFAPRELSIDTRSDGTLILRSPIAWSPCEWRITDFLPHWAGVASDRVFLAQRNQAGG